MHINLRPKFTETAKCYFITGVIQLQLINPGRSKCVHFGQSANNCLMEHSIVEGRAFCKKKNNNENGQ